MNLPNSLTIARIFFVPLLVAALVEENVVFRAGGLVITNEWLALAIFLAAAGTDLLDGFLARRWGQITTIGTLLDPIADKMLVSAALISLVQAHAVPAWMVVVIIGREFAVSGLRGIAATASYTIRASELGKSKMISQVVAISFLLLSIRRPNLRGPANLMMWAVVMFTLASAVDYFRQFWRKVDEGVKMRRRRELLRLERRERLERQRLAALGQSGSTVGGFRGTI